MEQEKSSAEGFKQYLDVIFLKNIPQFLNVLDAEFYKKMDTAFALQKVQSIRDVNYVQLMHDFTRATIQDGSFDRYHKPISIDEVEILRNSLKIMSASMFLEIKQNPATSPAQLLDIIYFIRKWLEALNLIHGIKIPKHKAFMKILDQEEEIANKKLEEYDKLLKAIKDFDIEGFTAKITPAKPDYDLYYWQPREKSKLELLTRLLISGGFVVSETTFLPLFSISGYSTDNKVDWKGKQAALVYLLKELSEKTFHFNDLPISKFSERFTIEGKSFTAKRFNSSAYNQTKKLNNKSSSKIPDYITAIDSIIAQIK